MSYIEQVQVTDVFTPTKPARYTFVERSALNNHLVSALQTPGKQMIVYGHSGSGKTTLLVNKLDQLYERHITTRCTGEFTFDKILLDAFDQLGAFIEAEITNTKRKKISGGFEAQYLGLKSKMDAERGSDTQTKQTRMVPPQLTAQALGPLLGAAKCCWVLEDFHKVQGTEKRKLAQTMKLFMDLSDTYPELKIIAIGAVDTARQVIEYDPEMRNRVAEIFVPLMNQSEIESILLKGQKLLNFTLPDNIRSNIVSFSGGLASICHQLCLNICFNSGIHQTLKDPLIIKPHTFREALEQYLNQSSDTLKASFDKALRKYEPADDVDAHIILKSMLEFSNEGATLEDLFAVIKVKIPNCQQNQLMRFLLELESEDKGALVKMDTASGRFSYSESLFRAFALAFFEVSGINTNNASVSVQIDDVRLNLPL